MEKAKLEVYRKKVKYHISIDPENGHPDTPSLLGEGLGTGHCKQSSKACG